MVYNIQVASQADNEAMTRWYDIQVARQAALMVAILVISVRKVVSARILSHHTKILTGETPCSAMVMKCLENPTGSRADSQKESSFAPSVAALGYLVGVYPR